MSPGSSHGKKISRASVTQVIFSKGSIPFSLIVSPPTDSKQQLQLSGASKITTTYSDPGKFVRGRSLGNSKVNWFFWLYCFLNIYSSCMANNVISPNITFSSINCNSLNMSNVTGSVQKRKIYGIAKLKTDLIFLSDIRLSNRNLTNNTEELKKSLRINPYCSYNCCFHSTKNKRGFGILYNSNLDFSVEQRVEDPDENFLAVRAKIKGNLYILCSIYGPNAHDPNFFISLFNSITNLGPHPIIIAGDWNCTLSSEAINSNPDCFNMRELPNVRHSRYLDQFCLDLSLQDPFRALNPVRKDFSYTPFGNLRENKSRIDFF